MDSIRWDELFDLLHYDPETGIFTNKSNRSSNCRKGEIAGTLHCKGYWHITLKGKQYLAHRLAWFYEYGKWPNNQIDHKDQVKLNNWISNLREATNFQNQGNIKSTKNSSSRFKGVCWVITRQKWLAQIQINRKSISLGYFSNEIKAAEAYNKAASEHFGEFAYLNYLGVL